MITGYFFSPLGKVAGRAIYFTDVLINFCHLTQKGAISTLEISGVTGSKVMSFNTCTSEVRYSNPLGTPAC